MKTVSLAPSPQDLSLEHEIDDEVRLDRLKSFWKRFRIPVVSMVLGCFLTGSAFLFWNFYHTKTIQETTAAYFSEVEELSPSHPSYANNLRKWRDASHFGFSLLARFKQAAEYTASDKQAQAIALYTEIKENPKAPLEMRAIAAIRAGQLLIGVKSLKEIQSYLSEFASEKSAWRFFVKEIYALAAYKAGNLQDAKHWIEENMKDQSLPAGMRQRHQILLDLLSPLQQGPRQSKP